MVWEIRKRNFYKVCKSFVEMANVFQNLSKEISPTDRYAVKKILREGARMIIHQENALGNGVDDNGVQDMAPRVIKDLTEVGVSSDVLRQAICIFYRDDPMILDQLQRCQYGKDYLRGLEAF